jgi:hypothetical protein
MTERLSPGAAAACAKIDAAFAEIHASLDAIEARRASDMRALADAFRRADFAGRYAVVALVFDDIPAGFGAVDLDHL